MNQIAQSDLHYQQGFGNHFVSEALPGALPAGQNSPQKAPYGLYAEQLSGSAFTAHRHENLRSWLYRIRPTVLHGNFSPLSGAKFLEKAISSPSPDQLRWDPIPFPKAPTDFVEGIARFAEC